MSFTRLLAAGQSIIGIKKEPGPYRVNQEALLPKFESAKDLPIEVDPSQQNTASVERDDATGLSSGIQVLRPTKRSFFDRWRQRIRKFFGKANQGSCLVKPRGFKRASTVRPQGRLVQAELSLDLVKVIRNDLKESDLEGPLNGQRAYLSMTATPSSGSSSQRLVWNRLSARLLRQAVQDFNVAQKERGKILTHAGDADRSAGGT